MCRNVLFMKLFCCGHKKLNPERVTEFQRCSAERICRYAPDDPVDCPWDGRPATPCPTCILDAIWVEVPTGGWKHRELDKVVSEAMDDWELRKKLVSSQSRGALHPMVSQSTEQRVVHYRTISD